MSRRTGASSTNVEVVLLPSLKNCLFNLPGSLVSLLRTANTLPQNVVVELQYRPPPPSGPDPRAKSSEALRSVFLGWTGMQSQGKMAPLVDGRGGGLSRGEQQNIATVEMDATFARRLGIADGTKASVSLHIDPPQAHTVNIEPITATDWEIIELHSSFLETNFLSQVRALPNPAAGHSHPLTLHLTPTSTANITVTSLTPAPAASQSFVKISPDAEVIVAPKTRQVARPSSSGGRDNRSTTSAGRRSAGGRSERSTAKNRSGTTHDIRQPIFLRALTRNLKSEWFEEDTYSEEMRDDGLKIWVDREHLLSKTLRGVSWVTAQIVKPAGLLEPVDPQSAPSPDQQPATRVVAKLCPWDDAPDARHAALSTLLCATLGAEDIVGGIVRIDPAPSPLPRTASALKEPSQQASKDAIVKRLKITPFIPTQAEKKAAPKGFKFGGESKSEREEATQRIKTLFSKSILEGPITDGMLLPPLDNWPGGILDFDPIPPGDLTKNRINWLIGGERKLEISIQPSTARQKAPRWPPGEPLPDTIPDLVGIDAVIEQTKKSLLHSSSVLLTGGLGSGKTSLAQLLALHLRSDYLFNTVYLPCRSLVSDETRVRTIRDTIDRAFAAAAWGARPGARALVVLDDLDKLCPVETELQVDTNGRSRHVAELVCAAARKWCGRDSGVVMLATAQSKESVNTVVTGAHVVRNIVALKAPGKDGRRRVLAKLLRDAAAAGRSHAVVEREGNNAGEWMEASTSESREGSVIGEAEGKDADLDLLEIAGQTDGYMPGDLALLVSRARSEALIRLVSGDDELTNTITLTAEDFTAALKGFTPASLRGVTLHSSTTTFASIGGLTETRQTLLETLQYPTTYAPLFAKCPLRLRSGLLLYGYPGCGKTLLASAVAGECGLNFISVKGPEILNKYIGASEKSVRDLFERAEAAKPCVLFFDEFDAIAPKRGHDSTGVTDRVVNMLLTMMDGAEGLSGVYVLAATSRPDLIDPALLRPGRLDKSLICDMPTEEDRSDILRAIGGKLKLDPSVLSATGSQNLAEVARQTEGYTGADLQAVMYNAHLEAIHDVLGPASEAASQDFGGSKRKGSTSNGTGSSRRNSTSSTTSNGSNSTSSNGHTASSNAATKYQDFTYFRLNQDPAATRPNTPAAIAAAAVERGQIAAKLAALQLSKRRARAQRHASQVRTPTTTRGGSSGAFPFPTSNHDSGGSDAEGNGSSNGANGSKTAEPVIAWRHLVKSLETTRSSISAQERRRLERIYREFVVGRDGEMKDGQGSSEIGGRTSLM